MTSLLDSDCLVDYLAGDIADEQSLRAFFAQGVAISTVTYAEVYEGVLRIGSTMANESFARVISGIKILPFSVPVARRCAELRRDLRLQGKRVRNRPLDLMIAATALHHRLGLVTRNLSDYSDIPGLTIQGPRR